MKIGLDLDGTVFAHPVFFAAMIESMANDGHQFFCTSSHARSEWPQDCERLERLGVNHKLIDPSLMYIQRHGDVRKKAKQADQLDIVFDDDARIQEFTKTPIMAPMIGGHLRVQSGKVEMRFS